MKYQSNERIFNWKPTKEQGTHPPTNQTPSFVSHKTTIIYIYTRAYSIKQILYQIAKSYSANVFELIFSYTSANQVLS